MNLCFLFSLHYERSPLSVSLATASLQAAAQGNEELRDWEVFCLETWPDETLLAHSKRIRDEVTRCGAKRLVLAFSVYVWNRLWVEEAVAQLRVSFPHAYFVAGGPEALTLDARLFDTCVLGEGETVFCSVLQTLGADKTPEKCIQGRIEDCGKLLSPWISGSAKPYMDGALWELSRGCPFRCSYCLESRRTQGVRAMPLERVRAELEYFVKAGVRQVWVLDATFNADPRRALTILDACLKLAPNIHFHFEARAELLDDAQARAFAALGASVQIGLQSMNSEALLAIDRPFKPGLFRDKVRLAQKHGMTFGLDLIYGLPGDTLAGFCASVNEAVAFEPNHLDIFPLSVLPGTGLAEKAGEYGLQYQVRAPYTLISSFGFTEKDMEEAACLARGVAELYNAGHAMPWFSVLQRALDMEAVRVFASFAKERNNKTISDWVKDALIRTQKENLVPLLQDLIHFHDALAAVLLDGKQRIINLHYDPALANSMEARKPLSFVKNHKLRSARWKVFKNRGSVEYQKL